MRRPSFRCGRLLALSVVLPAVTGCFEDNESLVLVESEKEANRVLVALQDHNIHGAQKEPRERQRKTFYEILVPANHAHQARQLLLQLDIPRDPNGGFLDMFSHSGLIPTKTDERARLMHAMAGELERTLEVVGRVVQARVHLALPEDDPLVSSSAGLPSNSGPTAAVLIKYVPLVDPGDDPQEDATQTPADSPISEEDVRRLVASSVEDLVTENVQVIFTLAPSWPRESTVTATDEAPLETEESARDAEQAALVQNGLLVGFGVMVFVVIFCIVRLRQSGGDTTHEM